MDTLDEDLVLEPIEDNLTDDDAALLRELQHQAIDDGLEDDLLAEATGPKLDGANAQIVGLMSVPAINGLDMNAIRKAVIARAVSQIGTRETPPYSNIIWAWDDCKPAWHGQPWCAAAVTSWWGRAGVDLRKAIENPYYCPYLERDAKRVNAWRANGSGYTPKLGDPILFGRGEATHVGISYPGPGSWSGYRTIEGNTSRSNSGSQTNGDGCYLRYRVGSFIRGWIDMDVYVAAMVREKELKVGPAKLVKAAVNSKPAATVAKVSLAAVNKTINSKVASEDVKIIQRTLNRSSNTKAAGLAGLAEDGLWTERTRIVYASFQRLCGYRGGDADGFPGPATIKHLGAWNNSYTVVA